MNPSEAQDAARTQSAGDPYEKVRNINLNNVRKIKNGLPPLSSWGLTPGFQVNKKSAPSADRSIALGSLYRNGAWRRQVLSKKKRGDAPFFIQRLPFLFLRLLVPPPVFLRQLLLQPFLFQMSEPCPQSMRQFRPGSGQHIP